MRNVHAKWMINGNFAISNMRYRIRTDDWLLIGYPYDYNLICMD